MNDQDKKLAELLKRELPQARRDPWFVRKVINRLPPRQQKVFFLTEKIVYGLAILLLCVWGAVACNSMLESQVWGIREMISCVAYVAAWAFMAWLIVVRVVKTAA